MNAATARALSLFDEFVELPAPQREHRLAALAAAEPDTHAALLLLLAADADDTAGVLERSPARVLADLHERERGRESVAAPTPAPEPADLRVGARLGAWRIDRIVGRGRMGTVYEAHRDDGQYQQRVAIKCLRAELDSPLLLAAMREERNLLARLDHPGIAALVDGGVDGDGRPWFALRYVEGEPIDAWCDQRSLGIEARVDLLLQVCDAVAYAHAQGVLHRDLKPSNVLITADGRAQLLDFGLSAQLGPLREAPGELPALTPHYSAPEARQHGAQGPATDLYALGVLSYRLLAGHWPTPLHGLRPLMPGADSGAPLAMDGLLGARPGDDALARQRGAADAQTLARQLRGDLAAIALKAVATRPQDRYPSVAEFADELRRWREGRPVRVRPGSWLARARKWLRRNRLAAGLGAAMILAAATGVLAAGWQHRQAVREAEANEQVSRLFASTLGSATLSGLGSARFSSRALLERSERELRALTLADQPALRAHALATLARSFVQIGDYRHAAALAEEAQRISIAAGDRDEDGFVASTRLSTLNYQGRHDEALALAHARLDALAAAPDPFSRDARIAIGLELARTQWELGRTEQALASADDMARQAQAQGRSRDARLAQALILRSGFLRQLGRAAAAEADAQRALALATPLDPVLADDALERLADAQRLRLGPAFASTAQRLLDERRRNLGPDHPQTAAAEVYVALARYPHVPRDSALATLRRVEAGYGREHPVYALALSRLAWTLARDRAEELRLQHQAVSILERSLPHSEMLFNARSNYAKALLGRGNEIPTLPRLDEGIALLERNIGERERAGLPPQADRYSVAVNLAQYGSDSTLPQARRALDAAARDAPRFYRPGDVEWLNLRIFDAVVRYREGRYAQADAAFAQMLDEIARAPAAAGVSLARRNDSQTIALLYRGVYALRTCRRHEAAQFLAAAVRLGETPGIQVSSPFFAEARAFERSARSGRLPPRPPLWFPSDPRAIAAATLVAPDCRGASAAPAASSAARR